MGAFIVECGECERLLNPSGIADHWHFIHPDLTQLEFLRIGSPVDAVSFWDDSTGAWTPIDRDAGSPALPPHH